MPMADQSQMPVLLEIQGPKQIRLPSRLHARSVSASIQLSPVKGGNPRSITLDELSKYRGEREDVPIYICIDGKVYDVSDSRGFYGPGEKYHVFAGRDVTRALGKGYLEDAQVLERPGDTSDFDGVEQTKLDDWIDLFENKYPCVAVLTSSGTKVSKL
mmetsp:Transcript_10268/g.16776  ORF Transcript_10268/g.16776 Transcript_10268/m.16776 type:complete len:158 (-) Transcript_10268:543-1016(-)|eukprot:CAMPEP_0203751988 /NCGR_PEP_ID=MMETSP0098-20131031/5982_1 /ASSEMBLY_ACC=CAM_ASM_000208 /TAXON_ID=96639 /ORGANISM=" , Strain NY0313808BC1" /LENGTH=157 /DNA_ID=CAMNT_0050641965 /DNA_START=257 /DNA_END=730 /DNA_ORIENTATION=-